VKDIPPSIEASVRCREWLAKEMAIIQPKVILCLGAPAAAAVLGVKRPISQMRGRWYTDNAYPPAVARVAFHPAYLLRLDGSEYDIRVDEFFEDLRTSIEEARRRMIDA